MFLKFAFEQPPLLVFQEFSIWDVNTKSPWNEFISEFVILNFFFFRLMEKSIWKELNEEYYISFTIFSCEHCWQISFQIVWTPNDELRIAEKKFAIKNWTQKAT